MNSDREKAKAAERATPSCGTERTAVAVDGQARRGRPRKDAHGRAADQQAFVAAATAIVSEAGLGALTARAVAARAGMAVGSVYAAFPSLEALRLGVNTVTMGMMRDALAAAVAVSAGQPLEGRLLGLADAYMEFADAHPAVWAALFEPRTMPAPPAMTEQTAALFALLEDVLRGGGCVGQEVPALARALWAAVHGTVFLAGHGSLGPVARDGAAELVHTLVRAIVGGIRHRSGTARVPGG